MELFGWLKSIKSRVRRFSGAQLNRISFPLGGVAAESIGRGGQGDLRDWQIFLRPDQGHSPAYGLAPCGPGPITHRRLRGCSRLHFIHGSTAREAWGL